MSERRDVLRTKKAIQDAYYRLLMEKGEKRITVSEVLKEADVSRGTFYAHYRDIPDLAEHVEDGLVHHFAQYMREQPIQEVLSSPDRQIKPILDYVEDNKERLRVLFQNRKNTRMIAKFKEILIRAMQESIDENDRAYGIPRSTLELLCVCMSAILVDAAVNWLIADAQMDRSELTRCLAGLVGGGLRGYLCELGVAV